MHRITGLIQQKRNQERVNLFLDGAYWISILKNDLLKNDLFKGKEILKEEKLYLEKISDFSKKWEKLSNWIARRPRSVKETSDYLNFKLKLESQETDSLLKKATDSGLLDDEKFARWFIFQRTEFGLHGINKIRSELINKGIRPDIVNRSISNMELDFKDSLERLKEEISIELKKYKTLDYASKNKIIRKFLSRGFNYEDIKNNMPE